MRRETTMEWIEERVEAILASYPRFQAERVAPIALLLMARDFGAERLSTAKQAELREIEQKIGLTDVMSPEAKQVKVATYIAGLAINKQILRKVNDTFETHYAVCCEERAAGFRRIAQINVSHVAKRVGEARPRNGVSAEEMIRRMTGMIRS